LQALFFKNIWKNNGISEKLSISFSQSLQLSAIVWSFHHAKDANVTAINYLTPPYDSNWSKNPFLGK